MARDNRLKYLLIDADFFDKEKLFQIENQFGYFGGYVAIRLLLWIAQREGWGVPWGEIGAAFFAVKGLGDKNQTSEAMKIAEKMAEVGFFDHEAHAAGYLTSRRIIADWRATMAKNHKEINTAELPDFIVKMFDETQSGKNSPESGEEVEQSGEKVEQSGETPKQSGEISPESGAREDKIRLDINNNTQSARARTREEITQDAQNRQNTQSGKTYTPEERDAAIGKIALWNQITQGTGAEYTDLYPQEILLCRIIDRIRKTPREEDWRRAFTAARRETEDGGCPWTLPAVFNKPGNFDQLKIKKPKQKTPAAGKTRFGTDRPGYGEEGYYTP